MLNFLNISTTQRDDKAVLIVGMRKSINYVKMAVIKYRLLLRYLYAN